MTLHYAAGGEDLALSRDDVNEALERVFEALGERKRVLALPPDFTRFNSQAGMITGMAYDHYGEALVDIMPALGTHFPMPPWQLDRMFPGVPHRLFREHDWRNHVLTVGEVPAEFVSRVTDGIYTRPWPCQLNRLVWEGGHDLILSIGQVVPHEVIGMANYTKNLFVGTGGASGINESHFIGAAYGMERMMGRSDTPLRRILNYGFDTFCAHLPVVFIQTVVGPDGDGGLALRGLFVGDDAECFEAACELSLKVNFTLLDEELDRVVVYLDPEEFHSTWLGNKSIYRTRMALADDAELIVLAPAVKTFGEDPQIDALIRKYGYRTSAEVMRLVEENDDLRGNLSAAAHLIHGSPENRFSVTYAAGELTRGEVEGVGYTYGDLDALTSRYRSDTLKDGWNTLPDGERFYYISNPALGLWASRERFA